MELLYNLCRRYIKKGVLSGTYIGNMSQLAYHRIVLSNGHVTKSKNSNIVPQVYT